MNMQNDQRNLANAIRALAMDAVEAAKSGHPGMPMGMADVATCLFQNHLKFDASKPHWSDRDRFILSAGHGSMLLYALLFLTGYKDMTMEEIKRFRQLGAKTAGHPEFGHANGIETTTGPLGQGFANGIGMAIAEQLLSSRFGDELVDHHTYVIAGDGCLMEGISHESASLAGHLKLGKLIVLYDDNEISIDGNTNLALSDDAIMRFNAYGWHTARIDGHDFKAIDEAIINAKADPRPSLIACKTIIGFGAPAKQGTHDCHGSPLGKEEIAAARVALNWPYPAFEIPDDILKPWRAIGQKGQKAQAEWEKRLEQEPKKDEFIRQMSGELPETFLKDAMKLRDEWIALAPKQATRISSQKSLDGLAELLPELLGGSADLTGSNNTKAKSMISLKGQDDFRGNYIHYGVREHAMAAAMNGITLHGGFIPYGGTFMAFSDYCRPAIRLSALMGIRVIYVMTHDSIGLGEDGPTHQPVEHLAALRAIPNLLVMRPADAVETLECWISAIENAQRPSLLVLSRQALAPMRIEAKGKANLSAKGGYVLKEASSGKRAITLISTGSELEIASAAREQLALENIDAAVVSLPCFELFSEQSEAYKSQVLGKAPRLAIEAGIRQGWDEWLGDDSDFLGMTGFGASAPAPALYQHFGLTVDNLVAMAKGLV